MSPKYSITPGVTALLLSFPAAAALIIDGATMRELPLELITTPTGKWPVADLGAVADGRAYLFRFTQKPDWYSLCIVRDPDGSGTIDERRYGIVFDGRGHVISALPGSMKCLDNGEPVRPTMARLRNAVESGRVLPYSAAAFKGWPKSPPLRSDPAADYLPDRIYGRSGMVNAIGAVTGAGGEYPSSRGFISGDDAVMIAAALAGDGKTFGISAARNRVQMLYGLSLPNLVIWSNRHHMLRDPQLPLAGDRPYANEGRASGFDQYGNEGKWTPPADYPYLDALGAKTGIAYAHTRDQAHLFNHGYAYWLATGDPRAALLQQAIMAYALAANYQRAPGRYRPRFEYQRTTLNQFSAMWKLRDVARNAETASGRLLWPKAQTDKMLADMWKNWRASLARLDRSPDPQDRSVSIFRGVDSNGNNAYSNFMIQGYGPEAAYLWASAGEPALLARIAENFVLRFGRIGGARGFYGTGKGSGFPILVKGQMPYRDTESFIAWVNANSPHPADSFEGAPAHYVLRGYWALRLAEDAARRGWMKPVDGLDVAIRKTETARDRTRKWKHVGITAWKHAGIPLP